MAETGRSRPCASWRSSMRTCTYIWRLRKSPGLSTTMRTMYVQVRCDDRQEAQGLLLPVSAILRDDENLPYVYVEQADGSFARAHVNVGYRSGDRTSILGGLHPGERVVTDGALFLQFMQQQ